MIAYLSLFCSSYLRLVIRNTDSPDDMSTGNHSEHSIQLRKAKKTLRIQDDTNVYVALSFKRMTLYSTFNISCRQVNLGKENMSLNPPIQKLEIIVVWNKGVSN